MLAPSVNNNYRTFSWASGFESLLDGTASVFSTPA